jgi:hypothetical protein
MVRRLKIRRVDVSVLLLSLRVVGWSGFGELGRSLYTVRGGQEGRLRVSWVICMDA